jgi:hypothetical protein
VRRSGITGVSNPIHVNRAPPPVGSAREERAANSCRRTDAFAVADHQIAHVYVARPEPGEVAQVLRSLPGVEQVLDEDGKRRGDHPRSGELIAISDARSWFTYYHFLDDDHAPDYARTVDIHRKPGYDPVELLVDPTLRVPKLRIAARLAQKALGMRYLMDVISLDATLVRGSRLPTDRLEDDPYPPPPDLVVRRFVAGEVKSLLLEHVFGAVNRLRIRRHDTRELRSTAAARLPEAPAWLKTASRSTGIADHDLYLLMSAVARHVGKDRSPSPIGTWPGGSRQDGIRDWMLDQAVRVPALREHLRRAMSLRLTVCSAADIGNSSPVIAPRCARSPRYAGGRGGRSVEHAGGLEAVAHRNPIRRAVTRRRGISL